MAIKIRSFQHAQRIAHMQTEKDWSDLVTYAPEFNASYQEILNEIKWADLETFIPKDDPWHDAD